MKNFIYGDLESKYERTVFKKIPGKAPEAIFYSQAGKELERLNIEKLTRWEERMRSRLVCAWRRGWGRGGEGLNAHLVDFDNMKVDGTALQRKGTGTPKIAQLQKIAFVNHKN